MKSLLIDSRDFSQKGKGFMDNVREKRGSFFRFTPEVDALIESHKGKNEDNRTEFVEDAIKYYCCHLDSESNKGVLSKEVIKAIYSVVKDQFNRFAHMLYKIAVELGVHNFLLAQTIPNMTESKLKAIRQKVSEQVRKNKGFIWIDDVVDEDAGITERVDD